MRSIRQLPTRELSAKNKGIFSKSYVQMLFASLAAGATDIPSELLSVSLSLGLDINLTNELGQTVLMVALSKRMPTVSIKALLRVGARLDVVDKMGKTVLMYALQHAGLEQQCLLDWIRACANIDLQDKKGKTLLMHAFEQQCPEVVLRTILDKGASIKRNDKSHKRVFVYAVENNAPKAIVSVMLQGGASFDMHTAGQQVLRYATQHGMVELAQQCTAAGVCLDDSFLDESFEGEDAAPVGERLNNHWAITFKPQLQRLSSESKGAFGQVALHQSVLAVATSVSDWVVARCDYLQSSEIGQFTIILKSAVYTHNFVFLDLLVSRLIDLKNNEDGQEVFRRSHGKFIADVWQTCFVKQGVPFTEANLLMTSIHAYAADQKIAFQPGCVYAIEAVVKEEQNCIKYVRELYKAGYSNLARFGAKAFKQRRDRPLDQLKKCSSFREAIELLKSRTKGKASGEKSKSRDVLEILMTQAGITTDADRSKAIRESKAGLTADVLTALQVRKAVICKQPKAIKVAASSVQPGSGGEATKRSRLGF